MSRLEGWTCRVVVLRFPDSPTPETLHARRPMPSCTRDAWRLPPMNPAGRHSARLPLPAAKCECHMMTCPACYRCPSWYEVCLEYRTAWGSCSHSIGMYMQKQWVGNGCHSTCERLSTRRCTARTTKCNVSRAPRILLENRSSFFFISEEPSFCFLT